MPSIPDGVAIANDFETKVYSYWHISARRFVSPPLLAYCLFHMLINNSVCVVSVLRVTSFDFDNLDNPTYDSVVPSTWSSIEQSVGIICACLPTIRPLLRWLTGSSGSSIRKRDSCSSEFPQRSPLSGRRSQTDEENSLDPLASPRSPTPLVSQMNTEHNRVSSSPAMDAIEDQGHSSWTLEESNGHTERHIPRPESFA
jgi:hypothetical protein